MQAFWKLKCRCLQKMQAFTNFVKKYAFNYTNENHKGFYIYL